VQKVENTEPKEYDRQRNKESDVTWKKKPDPFDLALWGLFVAVATAVIYFFQWQAQVETMRQDQRPWLKPEIGTKDGSVFNLVVGDKVEIPWTLTNVGRTPAEDVIAFLYVEIVKTGDDPHVPHKDQKTFGTPGYFGMLFPNTPSLGSVIRFYPGTTEGEPSKIQPLTPSEAEGLHDEKAYIAVYGTVKYLAQDTQLIFVGACTCPAKTHPA